MESITRAVYSPRALGVMYPVLRAFGSPRVGYGALAELVPRMNKVSAVTVNRVRRGAAAIAYRPASPEQQERSALICLLRKAQIAAGPTLWGLPAARVEETECQSRGGASCRYEVRWVERASVRGLFTGLLCGGDRSRSPPPTPCGRRSSRWSAAARSGRIWDLRAHGRELQAFVQEHTLALTSALDTTERRFVELEKAKAEVDARVEQRTAELRTATEKRVHIEKLAVLGTLAAGLAHEVRNPANAIVNGLGPVRRYLTETNGDPDYTMAVQIAIDAGDQIARLVGDLLDVGRTDRGFEPWDPHQGIEAAIRLLSHRTQRVSFDRDFRFHGEILGRPPALNQIFLNLFDNAVRAAGEGGAGAGRLPTRAGGDRDHRGRQRSGDPARSRPAHLRSVLHHPRDGRGDRPRAPFQPPSRVRSRRLAGSGRRAWMGRLLQALAPGPPSGNNAVVSTNPPASRTPPSSTSTTTRATCTPSVWGSRTGSGW